MTELADWEREALAKMTPSLPRYKLVPERTALVIIDMQYLDAHPDYGLGRRAKELGIAHLFQPYFDRCAAATKNIQRLLETSRAVGVEVIHVVISPYTSDARECDMVTRTLGYRPPRGSRETEVLDEIKPLPDETVLPKITSGAFASTPLAQILRNMGRDTLLVCGVVTNGCVETTVRDARDFGFKVVLVSDGCAAQTVEAHENTVKHMSKTRGNARDTGSVVAELRERNRTGRSEPLAAVELGV